MQFVRRGLRKDRKSTFSTRWLVFYAHQEIPANIRIHLNCQKLESLGYIFVADNVVYLHSNVRGGLRKTHVFWKRALQGHPRSLILAPIESAYATSYWSSIVTLALSCGFCLAPFQRYRWTFSVANIDPTPIPLEFWGVPFRLDCRCCGSQVRRPEANYSCN